MNDTLSLAIILFIGPLCALIAVMWVLRFVVALKAPPTRRAAWTAGIGYFIVVTAAAFAVPGQYWWVAPLSSIPAALVMFWWLRRDLLRAWRDASPDELGDETLANDDWRIGLLLLAGLVVLAVIRYIIRLVANA